MGWRQQRKIYEWMEKKMFLVYLKWGREKDRWKAWNFFFSVTNIQTRISLRVIHHSYTQSKCFYIFLFFFVGVNVNGAFYMFFFLFFSSLSLSVWFMFLYTIKRMFGYHFLTCILLWLCFDSDSFLTLSLHFVLCLRFILFSFSREKLFKGGERRVKPHMYIHI